MNKTIKAYIQLENVDWSIVEKKLGEGDLKGYKVRDVLREGLRFMAIAGTSKTPISPPPLVDEVWHNAMLDSRTYMRDVTKVFGKYLHHSPSGGSTQENGALEKAYWHGIELYEKSFGEIPIPGIWGLELKKKKGGKKK